MRRSIYKDERMHAKGNDISKPAAILCDLGRTRYGDIWDLQKSLHAEVVKGCKKDFVLLTEHDHVYTLGKGGDADHLLVSNRELKKAGVDYFSVDRGGDITYHGPGQIVGYPIIDLERYRKDVHWYLRRLEDVITQTLSHFGISGERSEGETGVWIGNDKIAAIGIKVSRWVTMHGFAFNINTDLSYYERIIPCGIFHKGVTSMAEVLKTDISVNDVTPVLAERFESIFNVTFLPVSRSELYEDISAQEPNDRN